MAIHENYRSDIDGLRGVAVALVVLFHFDVRLFKGGFIGVDVFYVISGYLITGIIVSRIDDGNFSFSSFYIRRIRRLFPALAAVLIGSVVASLFVLFPREEVDFGKSLAATSMFFANMFFIGRNGYFAGDSSLWPLLHTWSLAVEEQYYLVFPLVVVFASRWTPRALKPALWAGLVISLAICVALTAANADLAFYLMPSRLWELLMGAVLATGAAPEPKSRVLREALGAVGIAAIFVSGVVISKKTSFPGFAALAPTLGATLVIAAGAKADTFAHRLLSSRALVSLGLVSYSLYLWHFPVASFYKSWNGPELGTSATIGLGVCALGLAVVSYFVVERPFRFSRRLWPDNWVFPAAAMGVALLLGVSATLVLSSGLPGRFSPAAAALAAYQYQSDPNIVDPEAPPHCLIETLKRETLDSACLTPKFVHGNILLIGDSHADPLRAGLKVIFPETHFLQATATDCRPSLGKQSDPYCGRMLQTVFEDFLPHTKVDGIILAANWQRAATAELPELVDFLLGFTPNVIVLGPVPTYRGALPEILARAAQLNDPRYVAAHRVRERDGLDRQIAAALKDRRATYVSLYRTLCDDRDCTTLDGKGKPIQWDYGHLTPAGSRLVAQRLKANGVTLFPR